MLIKRHLDEAVILFERNKFKIVRRYQGLRRHNDEVLYEIFQFPYIPRVVEPSKSFDQSMIRALVGSVPAVKVIKEISYE